MLRPNPARPTIVALLASIVAAVAGAADNTPPAGFTALFNGKDLSNWKGLVADPPKRPRYPHSLDPAAQQNASPV